eukprot:3021620-Pleurochrysis_carterae.AAC.1
MTKNELYSCYELSYGTTTFNSKMNRWETSKSIAETQESWRTKMSSFVVYSDNNVARFTFTTASR